MHLKFEIERELVVKRLGKQRLLALLVESRGTNRWVRGQSRFSSFRQIETFEPAIVKFLEKGEVLPRFQASSNDSELL